MICSANHALTVKRCSARTSSRSKSTTSYLFNPTALLCKGHIIPAWWVGLLVLTPPVWQATLSIPGCREGCAVRASNQNLRSRKMLRRRLRAEQKSTFRCGYIVIMCYRVGRDHCTWIGVRGASTKYGIGGIMPCTVSRNTLFWFSSFEALIASFEHQLSLTVPVACSWTDYFQRTAEQQPTGGLPPHMPGAPSLSPAFPQIPRSPPPGLCISALPH